jgi:hypothetical protein
MSDEETLEDELNELNIPSLRPKKKSMSSEQASFVKKDGHQNEQEFGQLLAGSVVKTGREKADIEYNGYTFSLKKMCKRIQFALYSRKSSNWLTDTESFRLCKECLDIYPETYDMYKKNKTFYKENLREKIIALKNYLSSNTEHLREFLSWIMFKNNVDFLVLKDHTQHYIYYSKQVVDTLVEYVQITTSQVVKRNDYPDQKVLLKCENKNKKITNLIEIEIRNSTPQHFARLLCVCNRDVLFYLLQEKIKVEQTLVDFVVLKGDACEILKKE